MILTVAYGFYVFSGLPSLERIENPRPELATRVFSSDGEVLDQFFIKNRSQVSLRDIPDHVVKALIATEDKDFYSHWGVDAIRFFKAMVKTVASLFRDKEGASTQIGVAHDLAMRDTDPDYPAWLLVGHILGGDASSRLWMRLREKEGLSYGAGAFTSADPEDAAGTFGAYAIVAPQNLAKAKASMLEEITKIATGKVAADELARAKEAWIKDQDTSLSNDGYVADLLRNQTYLGRTTAHDKALRAKLQAVTAADLERVAKKHLQPSPLVIVDAGDAGKASAPATKP